MADLDNYSLAILKTRKISRDMISREDMPIIVAQSVRVSPGSRTAPELCLLLSGLPNPSLSV